jgi:hypothetical protein
MVELPALTLPPDGSVWVLESPEDLEGREVLVKASDGAGASYLVEHTERLDDGMLSVSLAFASTGRLTP